MIHRNLMVKSTSQIILSWDSKTINSPQEFSNVLLEAPSLDVFLQLPWEQTVAYQTILLFSKRYCAKNYWYPSGTDE